MLILVGYDYERIQTLNADHRSICKFDIPSDSNFRALRDSLASTVDDIERIGMTFRSSLSGHANIHTKYQWHGSRSNTKKCKPSRHSWPSLTVRSMNSLISMAPECQDLANGLLAARSFSIGSTARTLHVTFGSQVRLV